MDQKKTELLRTVVEKISQRPQWWKENLWSQVGRLTLIKTVLSSLPVYPFSNFKVRQAICKDIDRGIWNFFSEVIMKGSGKLFIKLEF